MNHRILYCIIFAGLLLAGCGDDSHVIDKPSAGDNPEESLPVCGDSLVEVPEICDDGNTVNGDGCSSDCLEIETGCDCPESGGVCTCSKPGEPEKTSICGDGQIEGDERCDDGNHVSGDGCSADCLEIESGFECPEAGVDCVVLEFCGDGELSDAEACDDGNAVAGDGCSADCTTIEAGYVCRTPGMPCALVTCGDGIRDAGEACDDGIRNMDYVPFAGGCSTACQKAHYCGDGLWDKVDQNNGEECDDGEDTSSRYNGCTFGCKLAKYCGDGIVQPEEKCDDGNLTSGDGCSSDCLLEDGFLCLIENSKSICSPIYCGNGVVDADKGEACDDGNRISGDGCSAICLTENAWMCAPDVSGQSVCQKTCGNGVIDREAGEVCDDGNAFSGDGCSNVCKVEPGYVCTEPGKACLARACGDGIVASGEACDDGNTTSKDGCSSRCDREAGWHCAIPGAPCTQTLCGDGKIEGDETCDEGHLSKPENKSEGCDSHCQTVIGWKCPVAGQKCESAVCGNGILEGAETCEEAFEGCVHCVLQPGYRCEGKGGTKCLKGACGDGKLDVGEGCDDGNLLAGDGCSPLCQPEPIFECAGGVCKPTCGDGLTLWEAGEECDDGNLSAGDGCSPDCKIENGFTCTKFDGSKPDVLNLPIIYRDFRAYSLSIGSTDKPQKGTGVGYFTQAAIDKLPEACKKNSGYRYRNYPSVGTPIPDFQGNACYSDHVCKDVIYPTLDEEGRPRLRPAGDIRSVESVVTENCQQLYTCPEVFAYWYRDSDMSITVRDQKLKLSLQGDDSYQFSSGSWWPVTQSGFRLPGYTPTESYQGLFTSEFQSYFKFRGNETLTFSGDDDVWVFFNGRLAIELAGIHGDRRQSIQLTPEIAAKTFEMYPGGIYSLQMFHAERCNGGSTYTLTMTGFINMGTSSCDTVCGDGMIRGTEECDYEGSPTDPELNKKYGCTLCKLTPYCGNGKVESGEGCDASESWCEACKIKTCGNGQYEAEHEQCDLSAPEGAGNLHKDCLSTCLRSGCGDGTLDEAAGEECDDGNTSDEDMCTRACKRPYCGDGIVTPSIGEACDDGVNDGSYGGCGFGCSYESPKCGDGILDVAHGELCDDGQSNHLGGYGMCNSKCRYDVRCGDGIIQSEYEACDDGAQNGGSSCTTSCQKPVN